MPRIIHEPIKIESYRTEKITCEFERITFFELVYIEQGKGVQRVEEYEIPFTSEDFFLLTPNEHHSLTLHEMSTVHFIKFQKIYFDAAHSGDFAFQYNAWFNKLEYIFHSHSRTNPAILKSKEDKEVFNHLMKVILEEYFKKQAYCRIIVQNTLFSLLSIIARNLQTTALQQNGKAANQTEAMLEYIHFHIYDADKLTVPHLAALFHISPTYFSAYFKKCTGASLKQYILNYKASLAEDKLRFTDLSLSEIAHQLQFTDLQHFNKTFLKMKGKLPSNYRHRAKALPSVVN